MTDQDWQEEQTRVKEVTQLIEGRIRKLEQEVGSVRGDVVEMRKDFWDEVTMNFSESDDVGETSTSMRQQSEILSDRERSHLHAYAELSKMKRLHQSPYFGRIDFTEKGEPGEAVYLGIASLLDKKDEHFLVYDWRAPISNLYYDSTPGPASYHTPSGQISGTIELKRQYVIRDGHIKFMFDTGVTIGDELLQQVLSRTSDAQMKSIVATIQQEQNRIIRNDRSRILIVQGAAGSGKTSAALQRVAYLLYRYREQLTADQVILFSPNPMFNSYVSTVLPELGEENMRQTTFQEYLEHRIGREYQLEDPFIQMEYVLSSYEKKGYTARIAGIQYKSSQQFYHVLNRYKELLEHTGMQFRPLRFQGQEIVSAADIEAKFYAFDPSVRLSNRCELLKDWLLKALSEFARKELKKPWVEEQLQLLDKEEYQRAYRRMRRKKRGKGDTFSDFEDEHIILAKMLVSSRLKPLRKWVKGIRFVDTKKMYATLFDSSEHIAKLSDRPLPEEWADICSFTLDHLRQGNLAYEDATPMLYLKEMILGFRSNTNIRHVFIDEVQDYSPFQLYFLKHLFPRARMTALGDLNQAIYVHASVLQQSSVLQDLYGPEESEEITLTRSYRSTQEIVNFTKAMISGGEHIIPFNRRGELPVVEIVGNKEQLQAQIINEIQRLKREDYETIAVICKTAAEAEEAYTALHEQVPVKLIKKTTMSFEQGIHIIPAYLAKGVEFDAVLIYNGSEEIYARETERKLFYTACTRAMHWLHIYSLGQPSPFILSARNQDYVRIDEM
ncbi:RNA polymerase recycling motor HelD [Paenibacillus shirakamiensis]|nr:RNA polymerase recycling motor HelD [Paenibacillus shirakamiensis]